MAVKYVNNNGFYEVSFGDNPFGSEQGYNRPALVIRTTKESPVCTVVPLTTQRLGDSVPYHIDLECTNSTVLVEQIRTIDKNRIFAVFKKSSKYVSLTENDWNAVNTCLKSMYRLKEQRK